MTDYRMPLFRPFLIQKHTPRLSFPIVAETLGLTDYWPGGSKRPAIVILLATTYVVWNAAFH